MLDISEPFGWSVQDLNQSSGVSNWDTNWSFSMAKMVPSDRYGRSMTVQDMIYTRWISHMFRLLEGISIYRYDQMHNFMNIYTFKETAQMGSKSFVADTTTQDTQDTRDPCDAWGSFKTGRQDHNLATGVDKQSLSAPARIKSAWESFVCFISSGIWCFQETSVRMKMNQTNLINHEPI